MEKTDVARSKKALAPFHLRTLTKSGGSRYLSVGQILPQDWKAVKVYVSYLDKDGCNLHIEPIR